MALIVAIDRQHKNIAKLLLEKGSEVCHRNSWKYVALVSRKMWEIVSWFEENKTQRIEVLDDESKMI